MNIFGGNGFGKLSQTAGTVINRLVPPKAGARTRVTTVVYTAAGTEHTVTALRRIGNTTTVASTAAAGQAVVNLTADPGPTGNLIAANDYVAIRRAADGITRVYKVSSVSTLAITMTANLATGEGLAAGDKVWFFGVAANTDPRTGEAHPAFRGFASATTTYTDRENGVVASISTDEPILLQSDNATAAGSFELTSYGYTTE